ncbi:SGNH hydrolase-type esterase domain-containing protein [Lasiosphaeris hirsuta]|uniref:SGNH hydrolase-type esterase domain-containing protein n=1 Tax=Lasiosphaeris hirsuta TaxID=260670 RepID=A0AA40B1S8_9PEZI|nr:SGNH hydrolase-type esterase domain-containing protein [Lasiosphaeris hirsuta]
MPLGGSITHGVGSSNQNGYREVLLQLLHRHGFYVRLVGSRKAGTMSNDEHEGWRAFRVDQITTKAKASAKKLQPHVFTVNAGSNDCLQGYKIEEASNRVGDLLESLWLACPGSTVVLASLLVNKDERVDATIRAFNQQLETLARIKRVEGRKIVFVDMRGGDGPLVEDLVEDGTHPNDAGYAKMAKIWLRGIQAASNSGFLSATRR